MSDELADRPGGGSQISASTRQASDGVARTPEQISQALHQLMADAKELGHHGTGARRALGWALGIVSDRDFPAGLMAYDPENTESRRLFKLLSEHEELVTALAERLGVPAMVDDPSHGPNVVANKFNVDGILRAVDALASRPRTPRGLR